MSNTTGMALQGTLNVLAGTTGLGADEAARRMVATAPYTGTGSPEGVVTATVGAKYIDSAATCGAVEWTKMSGSSNTGWVVTYGDTGLRNMTSALGGSSHYTINNADIRRVGNTVEFYCDFTTTASWSAGDTLAVLPAGFDPPASRYGLMTFYASSAAAIVSGYNINLYSLATGTTYRVHGTWLVTSSWPATALPGTAYTP